ncbi:MAG: pilin [bacterium]|nr:pilin [bacterium]
MGSTLLAQAPASMFPYQGPETSVTEEVRGMSRFLQNKAFNNGYESDGGMNALPNPLGVTNLQDIVDKVISALTVLAVPVVLAMVFYGTFKIITSGGDPAKAKEGGMVIFYAAVGFGLLLISNGIVSIIQSLF